MSHGIARAAVRGVFWTGLGQVLRQAVQVVSAVILARLLAPEHFGLVGMALFFVGIGQLLADFGIGSAIVQARSDDRIVLSSCFWLNVAVAGLLALVMIVASPLISAFYHRSDLRPLIAALSLNLLIAGVQAVPSALLYRDMRFADLARAQVLGSLAGALVAISMAWLGAGVWALVAQPLFGSIVALVACLLAVRWRPHTEFSWSRVAPLARFSFALLGTNLVGYANRNTDSLLVGRYLGAGPLGLYSMAIQLMLYPLQQVSSVIVRVLFPALVRLSDDLPRLQAAYLKAVGAIALVTFPMMGGLFAVADDFVMLVFGPGWVEMTPLLKILAWVGMLQSVATTVGTIYLSRGQPGQAFRVTVLQMPLLIGGIAVGLFWGIFGVALGYAIASFFVFFYVIRQAFRIINLRFTDLLRNVYRPLAATLAMVAVVMSAVNLMHETKAPVRLAVAIATGVIAYVVFSLSVNRRQIKELVRVALSARHASDS